MLLSFQACPDVQGTESTGKPLNEQLTSRWIIQKHISTLNSRFVSRS